MFQASFIWTSLEKCRIFGTTGVVVLVVVLIVINVYVLQGGKAVLGVG